MRRVFIILFLLAVCVTASALSIRHVGRVNDFVAASVARSLTALEDGEDAALTREIGALAAYWSREGESLTHFVRHMGIDDVTKSVARLRPLAAGKDYTELAAELESIRRQMDHLSQSERLAISNLW